MNPADLIQLLQQHVLEITFTKINGEQRVMPCTLISHKLPARPLTEDLPQRDRSQSPGTISVFCTDQNQWRSFRFENLKSWRIIS